MTKAETSEPNEAVLALQVGLPEGVLIALRSAGAFDFTVVQWGYGGIFSHSREPGVAFGKTAGAAAANDRGQSWYQGFANGPAAHGANIGRQFEMMGRSIGSSAQREMRPKHFLCFSVPSEKFGDIAYLDSLRHELPESFQTFFFMAGEKQMCIGAKSLKPFEILKYIEPSGLSTGVYVDDILETFIKWEQKYGVTIEQIGQHFVQIKLARLPEKLDVFAREVWRFCASVFDRGRIDDYSEDEIKSAVSDFEKKFSESHLLNLRWR